MKTKQRNILITGATGTIGKAVINHLLKLVTTAPVNVIAAVRNVEAARNDFPAEDKHLTFRPFDFLNHATYNNALADIHTLFLLRPPQITDISGVFRPLIERAVALGVRRILFISVQGAERSSVIPHNQIEAVIKEQGVPYVFLRPGYFMQNLIVELLEGIRSRNEIVLPAGNAPFNWVDADNVGEVAAVLLANTDTASLVNSPKTSERPTSPSFLSPRKQNLKTSALA